MVRVVFREITLVANGRLDLNGYKTRNRDTGGCVWLRLEMIRN